MAATIGKDRRGSRKENRILPANSGTVALETAGAVLGAGVGLALGGPAGALVGAGTKPIAVYASKMFAKLSRRFWQQFRSSLKAKNVSEETFVAELEGSEEKKTAFLKILQAAAKTVDPHHIDILAQAAANCVSLNAKRTTVIAYTANILSELNALHIRILLMVADFNKANPEARGVTPDMLLDEFKDEAPLLRSLVRTLELHGLILDNGRLDSSFSGVFWEVSEIGQWLLRLTSATETELSAENRNG